MGDHHATRPRLSAEHLALATAVTAGIAAVCHLLLGPVSAGSGVLHLIGWCAAGLVLHPVLAALPGAGHGWSGVAQRAAATLLGSILGAVALGFWLLVPVDPVLCLALVWGALAPLVMHRVPRRSLRPVLALPVALALTSQVGGAGAWSVDEPHTTTADMVAHNGIIESVDTHAWLLHRATVILAGDGHSDVADFLLSPDPKAPLRAGSAEHESYLWRMQTGARDADRSLKATAMPDHFFNFWTHKGKGLVAGPSAATWAEQQFTLAKDAWQAGDRDQAMYHLGAAAHLVDDGCAPPHASPFVPGHRAYEEWMVVRQDEAAVSSGGIYRTDFRVTTGHGGEDWSSSHTRGWVDECAHRAAELVVNTAQPAPGDPLGTSAFDRTFNHFKDTQRLTAGYLSFFFDEAGLP